MNRTESENDIEQILSEIENKIEHEYWNNVRLQHADDPEFTENMQILDKLISKIMTPDRPPEPNLLKLN